MEEDTMWGLSIMEGVVAILFGIAAVFWPGLTIITLLYLFAAFVLVSGVVNLITGIFNGGHGAGSWFLKILLSVVQIGIGVYLLRHPHVSFAAFILLIGFALIIRGVFDVVAAFVDDLTAGSRTMLIIAGVLAGIAGIIILFQPVSGGVAFVWILGLYALISGPIIIATALRHRHDRLALK
jgi:uncharacterized membrane protein HdeD (DUF308 family)